MGESEEGEGPGAPALRAAAAGPTRDEKLLEGAAGGRPVLRRVPGVHHLCCVTAGAQEGSPAVHVGRARARALLQGLRRGRRAEHGEAGQTTGPGS
jgi:hypothetical protein